MEAVVATRLLIEHMGASNRVRAEAEERFQEQLDRIESKVDHVLRLLGKDPEGVKA